MNICIFILLKYWLFHVNGNKWLDQVGQISLNSLHVEEGLNNNKLHSHASFYNIGHAALLVWHAGFHSLGGCTLREIFMGRLYMLYDLLTVKLIDQIFQRRIDLKQDLIFFKYPIVSIVITTCKLFLRRAQCWMIYEQCDISKNIFLTGLRYYIPTCRCMYKNSMLGSVQ
jgi:hypothetical protein